MKLLGKDDIIKADDIETQDVEVPEWKGSVRVRGMTGTQRDEFEEALLVKKGKGKNATREVSMANLRSRMVAQCIIGDDNKRVFSDGDIVALGRKSARALDRVFEVARDLSGFSEDDIEELVEDLEPTASAASHLS